jgi:hypothetical protein
MTAYGSLDPINNKSSSSSERKVNSLPPLGFELVIIGMLAHLSNHSTKSHPGDPN